MQKNMDMQNMQKKCRAGVNSQIHDALVHSKTQVPLKIRFSADWTEYKVLKILTNQCWNVIQPDFGCSNVMTP